MAKQNLQDGMNGLKCDKKRIQYYNESEQNEDHQLIDYGNGGRSIERKHQHVSLDEDKGKIEETSS